MLRLTHHQILPIVEPFARCGLQVDLAASDRLAGQLMFQPVHRSAEDGLPEGSETWQLGCVGEAWFSLVRRVALADGMMATVQMEGTSPASLLGRLQAVPDHALFAYGSGFCLARSHCLVGHSLLPAAAQLRTVGIAVDVELSTPNSSSAALLLSHRDNRLLQLPMDLLAVQGWDWSPLKAVGGRWSGRLRLHGRGASRGEDLARKLEGLAFHLMHTLGEPPQCYHQRLAPARRAVLLRLLLPWLAGAGLLVELMLAGPLQQARESVLTALALALPPALLLLSTFFSEQAQLEQPQWPRPLSAHTWLSD